MTTKSFFRVSVMVASAALVVAVAFPLWKPLLLAAVAAAALLPWHDRLSARLRGRPSIAAVLLVAGLLLPVLIALSWVVSVAVREALAGIAVVRDVLEKSGVEGLAGQLPGWVPHPVREWLRTISVSTDELASFAAARAPATASAVQTALGTTAGIVLNTVLLLIAFYFFLLDGRRLVAWLASLSAAPEEASALATQMARASRTVLLSLFLTALVQAFAATLGYLVARVPHAVFFGLLTFVAALIPSIGTTLVALPAALLMLALGHRWAALFLAVWALGVVGLIDNIVKPLLIKGGVQISGAVVFFSLLGGLAMFGPIGLIVGPLAMSLFVTVANARMQAGAAGVAKGEATPIATTPP